MYQTRTKTQHLSQSMCLVLMSFSFRMKYSLHEAIKHVKRRDTDVLMIMCPVHLT